MAKRNTRQLYIEKLDDAIGNIERCMEKIGDYHDTYKPYHPDLADHALVILQTLQSVIDSIEALRQST